MPDEPTRKCGNCVHMARMGRNGPRKCARGASQPPKVPGVAVGSIGGAVSLVQYAAKQAEISRWIAGLKTVTEDTPACGHWLPLLGSRAIGEVDNG